MLNLNYQLLVDSSLQSFHVASKNIHTGQPLETKYMSKNTTIGTSVFRHIVLFGGLFRWKDLISKPQICTPSNSFAM